MYMYQVGTIILAFILLKTLFPQFWSDGKPQI